jgi:membrane protease YdiL (CAAX protease family)
MIARMSEWVRGLSFRAEFLIVFFAAFGLPLAGTIQALASPEWWLHGGTLFTNSGFLRALVIEVAVGFLLLQFLVLRGWTVGQIGLTPVRLWSRESLMTPLEALGLLVAAYVTFTVLAFAAYQASPNLIWRAVRYHPQVAPHLPMATVLVFSVINAVFEEVFECGYVISSLRERLGVPKAVNISAGIRVALHLYQGPIGVLGITPFALIAAWWFARTRRLAPLIVAHALMDIGALALASWQ